MIARIGVDQYPFSGNSLGAVAGNAVAMGEMATLRTVELDLAVFAEAGGDLTERPRRPGIRKIERTDAEWVKSRRYTIYRVQ